MLVETLDARAASGRVVYYFINDCELNLKKYLSEFFILKNDKSGKFSSALFILKG